MQRSLALAQRYPFVVATLVVGLLTIMLTTAGFASAGRWLATAFVAFFIVWTLIGMVRDMLRGHFGLDILAVVAMTSTLLVGEYVAALIVALMLSGGEALEDYAGHRARRDMNALLDRSPQVAHRMSDRDSESLTDIPVADVAIGDALLVRPGELVPVDAQLASREGTFDESSLTGESLPVTHLAGEEIPSGAVNGSVAVTIQALRSAENSQYQQIVALVAQAQESKAPTVRLADRFAIPFTVISLLIGALAWILSGDPVRFAEVLVLATPCPLLIAAPVAFLGGLSQSSRQGIVVKGAAVLEELARVRSAAFDKTGTLTSGRPVLRRIVPEAGFTEEEVLGLAASAEQYSSHVLAAGIMAAARERGLELRTAERAEEVATHGVNATIGGQAVVVGKPTWVSSLVGDVQRPELSAGEAAVYVGIGGDFSGVIILSDAIRPESASVIDWLRTHGIERTVMLTGDVKSTADSIADQAGIGEVHAELLPSDKVRLAAGLQPRPVMMVGDGVNDAPVLAAADIGIAMGAKGATAAGQAADAVILKDSLQGVQDAVWIGQHTLSVARTAILIGIGLSVVLMLVASVGLIPAVAGALIQELVDVTAILYALRALKVPRS